MAGIRTVATSQIAGLYSDILLRAPDTAGLTAWTNAEMAGTSLATIRAVFATSMEAVAHIDSFYITMLGTLPTAAELTSAETTIEGGADIVNSVPALKALATSQLNTLYQQVFNRAGDAAGLAAWVRMRMAGESLYDIRSSFVSSTEEVNKLTNRYMLAFGHAPDAATLASMQAQVLGGGTLAGLFQPSVDGLVSAQPLPSNDTLLPFAAIDVSDVSLAPTDSAHVSLASGSGVLASTGGAGTVSGGGTVFDITGTAGQVEAALRGLSLTPLQANGTVSLSLALTNGFGDEATYGGTTLPASVAATITSADTMPFIVSFASSADDTLTATAAPDVFVEAGVQTGADVINGFDVTQDILQLPLADFANYAAVQAAMASVPGGTLISPDAVDSVTLAGVAQGNLTGANFRLA